MLSRRTSGRGQRKWDPPISAASSVDRICELTRTIPNETPNDTSVSQDEAVSAQETHRHSAINPRGSSTSVDSSPETLLYSFASGVLLRRPAVTASAGQVFLQLSYQLRKKMWWRTWQITGGIFADSLSPSILSAQRTGPKRSRACVGPSQPSGGDSASENRIVYV
jgi:hypothetical protein